MNKLYRIGFDIGIGSVGYAALENDPVTEDPIRILKLGVRTFSPNEVEKTGASTASSRRENRGIRRRLRRKKLRIQKLKALISSQLQIDVNQMQNNLINKDVYELRAKALDEKISNDELAKIILNIAKYRGFKRNIKSNKASGDDGKLLKAIEKNNKFIKDNGYRTWGEAVYKDKNFKITVAGNDFYNVRNHGGDYKNCVQRSDLEEELRLILKKQQEFNNLITDDFIELIILVFSRQRNFDIGPGKPSPYFKENGFADDVGYCTFYEEEQRAPKASFTFEYFNALSKINSLKIGNEFLSLEQKQKLYEEFKIKKELSFAQIRKMFNFDDENSFNLCRYKTLSKKEREGLNQEEIVNKNKELFFDSEKKQKLASMEHSYEIKKALGYESSYDNRELIDEIAYMLSVYKSDERIDAYIKNNNKGLFTLLNEEQVSKIKELKFDKFASLSLKAMNEIIPHLLEGLRYDLACEKAGFNHSSFKFEKLKYLKGDKIKAEFNDLTSNVVKRAANQTLRILNEIIKEYGSPQFVSIELARELSQAPQERKKSSDMMLANQDKNEQLKERLRSEFNLINPTGRDILTLKLYEEQNSKSMYTGTKIEADRLFEPNYVQIDHIIPYSRCFDDSYNNKVLVIADENQNKGDRTPYEYFGNDEQRWNEFIARANLLHNAKKTRNLLKKNFSQEESNEFINRNLNDTQYVSKFLLNLFQKYLMLTPSKKFKESKQIKCVSGSVTSYLRKCWGIKKIREDGDIHHCVDAAIIASVSEGTIQKITTFNKFKEKFFFDKKNERFISKKTGEVMTAEEKENYEKEGIELLRGTLPKLYDGFTQELKIRSKVNYFNFNLSDEDKNALEKLGYSQEEVESLKPVFISRMKNVKTTGAIHKDTMMSTREFDETKCLIKTVTLDNLKIENKVEEEPLKDDKYPEKRIANYYNPKTDRLLYLKLKEMLVEQGKILDKVYKPTKSGKQGPLVRSVKVYEPSSNPVITKHGAGANDKMYRVDVYEKANKFYLCPVYMSDVYNKSLPNKVIIINKPWAEIDDSYQFKFSLYQNDLIKVTSNKEIVMKKDKNHQNKLSLKPDEIKSNEFFVYYNGTDISSSRFSIISYDDCYSGRVGVTTLKNIEKYYVDIMGKIYKSPKEERKNFNGLY